MHTLSIKCIWHFQKTQQAWHYICYMLHTTTRGQAPATKCAHFSIPASEFNGEKRNFCAATSVSMLLQCTFSFALLQIAKRWMAHHPHSDMPQVSTDETRLWWCVHQRKHFKSFVGVSGKKWKTHTMDGWIWRKTFDFGEFVHLQFCTDKIKNAIIKNIRKLNINSLLSICKNEYELSIKMNSVSNFKCILRTQNIYCTVHTCTTASYFVTHDYLFLTNARNCPQSRHW